MGAQGWLREARQPPRTTHHTKSLHTHAAHTHTHTTPKLHHTRSLPLDRSPHAHPQQLRANPLPLTPSHKKIATHKGSPGAPHPTERRASCRHAGPREGGVCGGEGERPPTVPLARLGPWWTTCGAWSGETQTWTDAGPWCHCCWRWHGRSGDPPPPLLLQLLVLPTPPLHLRWWGPLGPREPAGPGPWGWTRARQASCGT